MVAMTDETTIVAVLFFVVFVLNLIPAFAPPTWMTISFLGLTVPSIDVVSLALVGATGATLGRLALAKLARVIVRPKLMAAHTRRNVDAIRQVLENRRVVTLSIFTAYAFSPLPSNYLFIAYGLTALPLAFLALPFFVGRFVSYGFWIVMVSVLSDRLNWEPFESAPYFGLYFILSQLLLVPVIYAFTRLDWHAALSERNFKWFRVPGM